MSPVWLFLLWLEFFWKTSKSAYWDNVGVGSRNVYASCKPNQSTNWFNMHCELKQQPVKLSCKLVRRNSEEVLREIMAACRLPRSITQQWWSGKDGWSVTLSAPYHPMAVTHFFLDNVLIFKITRFLVRNFVNNFLQHFTFQEQVIYFFIKRSLYNVQCTCWWRISFILSYFSTFVMLCYVMWLGAGSQFWGKSSCQATSVPPTPNWMNIFFEKIIFDYFEWINSLNE